MLSDEVCPRSPLASAVIVKNTFIDMEDEAPLEYSPRRATSEPPSRRHRDSKGSPCFQNGGDDASTTSGSPREMSGSDNASEERSHQGSPTADLACTSAGLNPNAPVWRPSWSPSPSSSTPAGLPGAAVLGPPPSPVFYQMPPQSAPSPSHAPLPSPMLPSQQMMPHQAFSEQLPLVPPPPPPPPLTGARVAGPGNQYTQISSQHRLNANAKAWQPGGSMAMAPAPGNANVIPAVPPPPAPSSGGLADMPSPFRSQMQNLLEATKKALEHDNSIVGVDILDNSGGWGGVTVVAWQRDTRRRGREEALQQQILKSAGDALKRAAEHSQSVYVLGYRAEPFERSEFGFTGTLAGMLEESKACWDMFSKGHCRHQWDCRWQHAACTLPFQVELRASRD